MNARIMLTSRKKNQERKPLLIDEQMSYSKNTSDAFKQKLIAIACISFFPLVYLIGSSIVKYFG